MNAPAPRLLITGSRDWADADMIFTALRQAWTQLGAHPGTILVSGNCPTGADKIAEDIWEQRGHIVERHPADWSKGRSAGPARNKKMVELGADLCLAFIGHCTSPRCKKPQPHDSHGATGCSKLAAKANIPVREYRPTERTTS
ncbi:DUF2493 domain-containing protein [Aeromicrobium sp. 179-A 4D2 NHS]|uniref:DUF2493 domain-containing protein n=1 Tax=Aeromicrobium sp. 179-A 4D2 NHS TaxID=3142375 RepID=UPI0039A2497C